MSKSIFYWTEFSFVPLKYAADRTKFFTEVLYAGEKYFANEFNKSYEYYFKRKHIRKRVKFKESDFKITIFNHNGREFGPQNKNDRILFVLLPHPPKIDTPGVYCNVYAIPFRVEENNIKLFPLYMAESGMLGTYCLGSMDGENHLNFGPINGPKLRDIAYKIKEVVFDEIENNTY